MRQPSFHRRVVSGEAGLWALPIRAALRVAESLYTFGVALRNGRYNRPGAAVRLPIPIISVGNITVGGTGKTPMVIELARRLDAMNRSPALISRGYGSVDGAPNDEERLIRRHCPGVLCLSDPDRVAMARRAYEQFEADVIVLDDGFQYRRLARTLDIVLIDSTCPFGFDHVLPRGLLREPASSLRRADVVVMTRCDQVSRTEAARIEHRLRRFNEHATLLKCRHRVASVETLNGSRLEMPLEGKRAMVFAGVGNPDSFVVTAASTGVDVVGTRFFPDHHRYRHRDVQRLCDGRHAPPFDVLLTTEKDAVKLAELDSAAHAPIVVAVVAIEFLDGDGAILDELLRETLAMRSETTGYETTPSIRQR